MRGIDYAWGKPDYDALVKDGIQFVMRYISLDPTKDLDAEELAELEKRGIGVGLVFETTPTRALAGYSAGASDAKLALTHCDELGLTDIPVYFAVDWDITDAQKPAAAEYLKGASSVLGKGRVGVYGGYYAVKYMYENQICSFFWQTYAWSGGLVHPAADIYQYKNGMFEAGESVDDDKTLKDNCGLHFPVRHPAAYLIAQTGYWSWVQWRLGEDNWFGWGPCNPAVRPNVPKLIVPLWWIMLQAFLAARHK